MSSSALSRACVVLSSPFVFAALGAACGDAAPSPPPEWNAAARFKVSSFSYLGSAADDQLREILPEADGSIWIAGQAGGPGFPTTPGVLQASYAGEDTSRKAVTGGYGGDCWIGRLAADGKRFVAASYFGGSRQERNVYGLERAKDGDLVFTTMTRSPDLKTTPGSFQPRYGGGSADWYVARVAPDLKTFRYATFLGGEETDFPRAGLALDAEDRPVVVGYTGGDFPSAKGASLTAAHGQDDVVVAKLSADGAALIASARVGGRAGDEVAGVVVSPEGDVFYAGQTASADFPATESAPQRSLGGGFDAAVVRLLPDLSAASTATFLGGSKDEFSEHRLLRTAAGDVYVTGSTGSSDFPATKGAWLEKFGGVNDGFLVRYAPDLSRVVFATFVGGKGDDNLLMPTLGPDGSIWCVGFTSDPAFPTTPDALQPKFGGGKSDGIVVAISADGARLVYASYFGGDGTDTLRSIAFLKDGSAWLVGTTSSKNLSATPGAPQPKLAGGTDGFILKLAQR